MPEEKTNRGDHNYVNAQSPDECLPGLPPKSVYRAEQAAIQKRRDYIMASGTRNRTGIASYTGLAFSGGGIRSASFGLGALQALHTQCGIEGIDYLSTVSGGGYIGCSLTATLQKSGVEFPFTNSDNYDDTDSVRHIRDYSNYLIPHGALDVVTALGLIGRGLVANTLIVLPVLLFCVWITLLIHPNVDSLGKPVFLIRYIINAYPWLPLLPSLHGYWFTAILVAFNLLFLTFWALFTSMNVGKSATLRGGWVGFSRFLFLVTLVTAFFETQPFILWVINPTADASDFHTSLNDHWSSITSSTYLATTGTIFGFMATVFAFISKYLGDVVAVAKRATGWLPWLKKLAAMAALWLAGLLVPILLWFCYLRLVDTGLEHELAPVSYLAAFVLSTVVALFINPNRTSLYRLYRDRLSKAFLFDPDGRPELRDENGDLRTFEPKLYEIDTDLCPYPIVNAALNIEGSQYANKRGRNADFFIFTPEYTGSGATGYIGSQRIKKDAAVAFNISPRIQRSEKQKEKKKQETALDLGTAMAISGAAVSSNMGSSTIKALTFTLAILNIRLGYWLRNPNPGYTDPPITRRQDWIMAQLFHLPSFVLFAEMFGQITEKSPKIYLTDGGHIENLGVYSLLKRRCKVIIAVDAEADPTMSFGAFLTLERYARIDLGVIIELPWQTIRNRTLEVDKAFDKADSDGSAIPSLRGLHCAAGEIQYGPNENEKGILLYVKASLSGDEDDYILDYKRRYRAFPHETTGDQFFSEEQLEVYRALGFHIMKGLLTGEASFAVEPRRNESESEAQLRILMAAREALLGIAVKSPVSGSKINP